MAAKKMSAGKKMTASKGKGKSKPFMADKGGKMAGAKKTGNGKGC